MAAVCSPGQWCYLAWRLREHSTWTQTAKVCRHSWSNVSNLPWGGPFIRPLHALHAGWGNRSHNNILKIFAVDLAKRWCLMSYKKRASSVYLRQLQLWCHCNKMTKTLSTNHLVLPSIRYLSFNVCNLAIISSDCITSMTPHCPLEIVMCLRKKNNWSRILSLHFWKWVTNRNLWNTFSSLLYFQGVFTARCISPYLTTWLQKQTFIAPVSTTYQQVLPAVAVETHLRGLKQTQRFERKIFAGGPLFHIIGKFLQQLC